jgi:UDP-N-acetylmuramate dehydrogenase
MENEPMAQHTSFRIGGPARLYLVASSSEEVLQAIDMADALNIPWAVYGGGSNVFVADEGYEGVLIQIANRRITHHASRNMFEVEAGAITALVARKATEAGLAGFEWAVGIPGTIGGALYGDAGCFGGEMKDCVAFVDAYRVKDKTRVRLTNAECRFGYRDSLFKHEPHVIFGCEIHLAPATDPAASKAKLEDIMRERKAKQPLNQSSAGCIFKNYDFSDEKALEILRRRVEVPEAMIASKRLAAGWLIDQAGLLGYELGTAAVSQTHGNFFVNKSHARAQDVLALISLVKMNVRDKFGIELQEEVQYLGFS